MDGGEASKTVHSLFDDVYFSPPVSLSLLPASSLFLSFIMSANLLNAAGKRMLAGRIEQYRPSDPMYEEYTDSRGKVKRRKVSIFNVIYLNVGAYGRLLA
jgi:hypothetical protein